jgi:hypothetical protein
MDIIRTINPLCLALAPYAALARTWHQIPILMKQNPRSFDKYSESALNTTMDMTYADDAWLSFQFLQWRLKSRAWPDYDEFVRRIDNWSVKHFGVRSKCMSWEGDPYVFVKRITRKRPSRVIRNHTHLFVYCPMKHTLLGFVDHYYCDGHTLRDFFRQFFIDERLSFAKFPKYTYYPFLSDAMAIQATFEMLVESCRYPSQIQGIDDKTRVLSKMLKKAMDLEWNRWTVYAIGTLPVFDSMPDIDYVNVALTVGFDTDQTYGNNRIGAIIVNIQRPTQPTFNERVADVMGQYKTQATVNYAHAHATYDIQRGYDTRIIRTLARKRINIVFSSIYVKEHLRVAKCFSGFVGAFSEYELLYISAVSLGECTIFTYVSNLKQMDYSTLKESGLTLEYEFENSNPRQY